jgi:hypothetical protein
VQVVRRKRSGGVAAARNAGLERARGGWVAFLDDDDIWAPAKLAAQLAAARAVGRPGLVYGSALNVTADLDPLGVYPALQVERALAELVERNHLPAGASNVLARAALVRELGGFDTAFGPLADWDLWLRLAAAGGVAAVPEVVVAYVQHAGAMSAGPWLPLFAEYDRLRAKHAGLARRLGARPRPGPFLTWAVGRQRDGGAGRRAGLCSLHGAIRYRDPRSMARGVALVALPRAVMDPLARRRTAAAASSGRAPAWLDAYRSSAAVPR